MSRTVIACVLCLLLAGCTAPTAPSQTPTPETGGPNATAESKTSGEADDDSATNRSALADIPVSGGSLPVEHERVFARTTDLLGVNVSPPTVVVVKPASEIGGTGGGAGEDSSGGKSARTFADVMGISGGESADSEERGDGESDGDGGNSGVSVAAYAPSAHSVVVNERMTVAGREGPLERTMAHEFVHTVQFRQQAFSRTQTALGADRTPTRDTYLTYASIVEGTAAFVGETYDRRYLAGDWATITDAERYRSSPARVKYKIARYYFGVRYLRHRYDSPANLSAVYDDPPQTTEQVLHNDTDDSEKPKSLAVSVDAGQNRTLGRTDTYGELFTRIALGTEMNESQAADAAAGWGADRLVPVTGPNGTRSYVWATRWDSSAEADEFESGMREYLSSRANRSGGTWRDDEVALRSVQTSEETVVLLVGTESFVSGANASGTNASVSVVTGDDHR
ncbi:hypothetical protein [Halorussus lipolyticus]|uniref:hypothetical protein n=1 Tax=Halorussus lipolyticus TaxID=3034024 RepID=UPI0023E89616|nr:hypothetical protein [Halorussus sp. DT80]